MALVLPRYVYDAGAGNVIIDFTAPIAQDPKPQQRVTRVDALGGTGIRQSNFKFVETVHTLTHEFVPESEIDLVDTMMTDWVLKGNTFDFYEDQTVTGSFITVELLDKRFRPRRMSKKLDIWRFSINVRVEIT